MLNQRLAIFENNGNDVETRAHIEIVFEKIGIGRLYQPTSLLLGDGFIRSAIFIRLTCLHLNNDQILAIFRNDVNLLMLVAPVAFQNLVALPYQVIDRKFLAEFTKVVVLSHISFILGLQRNSRNSLPV